MNRSIYGIILAIGLPAMAQAQDASAWAGFNVGIQASKGEGSQQYFLTMAAMILSAKGSAALSAT